MLGDLRRKVEVCHRLSTGIGFKFRQHEVPARLIWLIKVLEKHAAIGVDYLAQEAILGTFSCGTADGFARRHKAILQDHGQRKPCPLVVKLRSCEDLHDRFFKVCQLMRRLGFWCLDAPGVIFAEVR